MAKMKGKGGEPCFVKEPGGVITGSPQFANDAGFGTPMMPGRRGEAYGGDIPGGQGVPGKNGDFNKFFSKGRGKKK